MGRGRSALIGGVVCRSWVEEIVGSPPQRNAHNGPTPPASQ